MVQPQYASSASEDRVDRLAKRYAAEPMNCRLLKRLWLTPNHHHGIQDLASGLHAASADVQRAMRALASDGLVREGQDGARTVYVVASSLSAHGLISQLLTKDAAPGAEQLPRC